MTVTVGIVKYDDCYSRYSAVYDCYSRYSAVYDCNSRYSEVR